MEEMKKRGISQKTPAAERFYYNFRSTPKEAASLEKDMDVASLIKLLERMKHPDYIATRTRIQSEAERAVKKAAEDALREIEEERKAAEKEEKKKKKKVGPPLPSPGTLMQPSPPPTSSPDFSLVPSGMLPASAVVVADDNGLPQLAPDPHAAQMEAQAAAARAAEQAKQEGNGLPNAQLHDVPLSNTQIDWLMKDHPEYRGVVSRDEINKLTLKGNSIECFVMNLDPASQPGSHWVAFYLDLRNDDPSSREINYYDSFGRRCPPDIYASLERELKRLHPPTLIKFKENRIKNQASDANTCGWFCVMFLQDRLGGKPFAGCTGYEDLQEDEIEEVKAALVIPESFDEM